LSTRLTDFLKSLILRTRLSKSSDLLNQPGLNHPNLFYISMSSTFLNYWTIGFGYALLYITPYISELSLLVLSLFQIRYYLILGEREAIRKTIKILKRESYTFSSKYMYGKDIPTGYFFGMKCAGYIDNKHP
jgi:hypothetical protein